MVCAGAFSFFVLFLGKLALCDGGFAGFLCAMCFLMCDFVKSQAFICVENCIFFLCVFLRFVLVLCVFFVYNDSKIKENKAFIINKKPR